MAKKVFSDHDAESILDDISRNAAKYGGNKINGYARGFLVSLLTSLADGSPTTNKKLLELTSRIKTL